MSVKEVLFNEGDRGLSSEVIEDKENLHDLNDHSHYSPS